MRFAFPVRADAETEEWLAACRESRLLLVRDRVNGAWHEPSWDRSLDPDRFVYEESSRLGRVISWSTTRTRTRDGDGDEQLFGIVQLDEGPWLWMAMELSVPAERRSGIPVRIEFAASGPEPEHAFMPFATDADDDNPRGER